MKTKQELLDLKTDWRCDPCWDIELTEGFEEHYDELLQYRLEMDAYWKKIEDERILKRSKELGIEGNYKSLYYLEGLERSILKLTEPLYDRL